MKTQTKMTKCVFCGKNATKRNSAGQPVCKKHKDREPKEVACPECGMPMRIKEGRYGYFWGCEGYPQCQKTYKIETIAEDKE
ncbi:MAG: topoisomerase DNA-binding C4 zinc finger domain-containing protein [Candidatus Nanohaloarchaea archaeon]